MESAVIPNDICNPQNDITQTALVRPHLAHAKSVWSPHLKKKQTNIVAIKYMYRDKPSNGCQEWLTQHMKTV